MSWFRGVLAVSACLAGSAGAVYAAAKDESAAEWLAPQWFNEWHDGLASKGLNFGATYIDDNIGNATGGTGQGMTHLGRFDISVDADLEKLIGWTGGHFYANTYQIYGSGLTHTYVHNLATISESEALADSRLYNAYFEQSFYDGALNIRFGQQAADVEFFDSQTDDLFINGSFGWPAINGVDLPAGGPAPPIAALGIRVKAALTDRITAFAAVFNGDASRPGPEDPQLLDSHGTAFRVNDAPWVIGQVRWDYDLEIAGKALAGNFTPGAWYHFGDFNDQRIDTQGLSLANPDSNGMPAQLKRNFGLFATIEQTLYRPPSVIEKGVSNSLPGITVFGRLAYSPPDRNLIDLYADGGLGFVGLVPNRPNDRIGIGLAYMRISGDDAELDRDTQFYTGVPSPVRTSEKLLEIIYEAHLKPGLLMAPYFQYVFRPAGGIPNPNDPTGVSRIGDAAVFGVTTTIKY
jgi:porin